MRKKIDDWIYENWLECSIGLFIGEILATITIYLW